MKTDRELLELAAKACGYQPDGSFGKGLLVVVNAGKEDQRSFGFDPWNDDGDALRLAVKLGILQSHTPAHARFAMFYECCLDQDMRPSESTRCAIVSASAEIGKAMA